MWFNKLRGMCARFYTEWSLPERTSLSRKPTPLMQNVRIRLNGWDCGIYLLNGQRDKGQGPLHGLAGQERNVGRAQLEIERNRHEIALSEIAVPWGEGCSLKIPICC